MSTNRLSHLDCGYRLGESLGTVTPPAQIASAVSSMARDFYQQQEATDFNEQVDTMTIPAGWQDAAAACLPSQGELRKMGLRLPAGTEQHLVLTTGVEPHHDAAFGLTLLWTLHNDAMSFKQGGLRRVPAAGDLLIFDDDLVHSMDLAAKQARDPQYARAGYIGWAFKLARL